MGFRRMGNRTNLVLCGALMLQLAACGQAPEPNRSPGIAEEPRTGSPSADGGATAGATSAGRYNLGRDEERGGHTLKKHVGRTDEQLQERLRRERISAASTCNSPASTVPLADSANGRTYDHDQNVNGDPVIGALRPEKRAEITAISCISHCFQRTFTVPNGVYLVRLQFGPEALLRQHPEFSFVLNDRKVAVEFEPSADYLDEEFLVRPERNLIKLQANANADCSIVTNVEIISFDSSHGDGAQVVPW